MQRKLVGVLIVLLGVFILLDQMEVMDMSVISKFWPIAIIAIGLVTFFERASFHLGGAIITFVGVALLMDQWDLALFGRISLWQLAGPVLIVLVGLKLIFPSKWQGTNKKS